MPKESLSRKLLLGLFYLFSSSIVTLGIKIVTVAYIARKLGVENFGLYSALIAFVGLFQFLSDFGLNKTLLKFGSKDLNHASISFGNALFVKTTLIIPLLVFVYVCGYFLGYKNNEELFALLLFALSMIFDSYAHVFTSIRRIFGYFKLISFFRVVKTILLLLGYIYVLSIYKSIFALAVATLIMTLVMFVASLINTIFLIRPKLKLSILIEFYKDSVIFSFNDFFLNIYSRIGIVILSFYNEMFIVGIYSAAIRFTKIAILLPRQVRFALLPTIYRLLDDKKYLELDQGVGDVDEESSLMDVNEEKVEGKELISAGGVRSRKVFDLLFKYMIIFAAPLAVIVCYYSQEIIHLIFGKKYDSSILFVQIFTIFIFLRFIETPISLFYLGLNKHKNLVTMQGITSLINVILCFILIPKFSAYGAAFATNISEVVFVLMIAISGISYNIWNMKNLAYRIICPLFACIVALWGVTIIASVFNLFIQLLVFFIFYFVLLIIIKQFGDEDKLLLKKMLLKRK